MKLYPMILKPFVSETIWGGRKLIDEYHVETEKANAAEGWMLSCHPSGFGSIVNGELAGVSLPDAIQMITVNPLRMMKLDVKKGLLKVGYDADICIFDKEIHIEKVLLGGEIAIG